jgi:hypothetical protein
MTFSLALRMANVARFQEFPHGFGELERFGALHQPLDTNRSKAFCLLLVE